MPAGRPSNYDPKFCDDVIALGDQGKSVAYMAGSIGVTKNTLDNWAASHEEFLIAFTRARQLSQMWWEDKGQDGMERSSSEFQSSIWSRSMAARFPEDWREVKGVDVSGQLVTQTKEQRDAAVAAATRADG